MFSDKWNTPILATLAYGQKFPVYSDHKPLENMNIKSRTDRDVGDSTHHLSQYYLHINYSPAKLNREADCLSRNSVLEPHENQQDFLYRIDLITLEDIKNERI